MALTKAHNRMITGSMVNALDYMTQAQIADVTSGTGSIDVAAALNAALDASFNSGNGAGIFLPEGKYLINSDVNVDRGMHLFGEGYGTHIVGTGGGVVLNNALVNSNNYAGLHDLRISRTDSGTALTIDGSAVDGVSRYIVEQVYIIRIDGKSGTAVSINGSWNVDFFHLMVSGWDVGLNIFRDKLVDEASGANGIHFFGGQIEGNNTGVIISGALTAGFYGTVLEGNSTINVDVDAAKSVIFDSIYCEANGTADIRIGNTSAVKNCVIRGGYFNTPAVGGLANSILAENVEALRVETSYFARFTGAPIKVGAGSTGAALDCEKDSAISIPMVDVTTNSADRFRYLNAYPAAMESELTIASGAITPTASYHTVDTEGNAASDDLDTINGGCRGEVLTLVAASGSRTVNVTNAGNINVPTAGIALVGADKVAQFIYREATAKWELLSFQDNT